MTARRQMTTRPCEAYRGGSKPDRGRVFDLVVETTGMGRSTARRLLSGPRLPNPKDQIDKSSVKPRLYSGDTRLLLEHVWILLGFESKNNHELTSQ